MRHPASGPRVTHTRKLVGHESATLYWQPATVRDIACIFAMRQRGERARRVRTGLRTRTDAKGASHTSSVIHVTSTGARSIIIQPVVTWLPRRA